MQTRVLVAYTTNAGSTSEVAEAVAAELEKTGAAVLKTSEVPGAVVSNANNLSSKPANGPQDDKPSQEE